MKKRLLGFTLVLALFAGQVFAQEEYTLGVVLPFTGSLGSFGVGFRNGVELAVEQMNAELEA
ncbi:MAG: hypothetical protein KC422_10625, partial [Trueperaceae bacterium]|nr:hypothetical protein [Trueperaceae bacterium]